MLTATVAVSKGSVVTVYYLFPWKFGEVENCVSASII